MDKSIHTKLYQRMIARLRAKREEKGGYADATS